MHLFSLSFPVFCCFKGGYGHQSYLPVVDHFEGPYRAGCCLRKQEDEPLARQAVWRGWVSLCSIDEKRTLFKLYLLSDLWPYSLEWTAILRLCLEHDSLFANKQTTFVVFVYRLQERFGRVLRPAEQGLPIHLNMNHSTSTASRTLVAAACPLGMDS